LLRPKPTRIHKKWRHYLTFSSLSFFDRVYTHHFHLYTFYGFINRSHELTTSSLDKTKHFTSWRRPKAPLQTLTYLTHVQSSWSTSHVTCLKGNTPSGYSHQNLSWLRQKNNSMRHSSFRKTDSCSRDQKKNSLLSRNLNIHYPFSQDLDTNEANSSKPFPLTFT
jgi:hypothetical protein